MQQKDLSVFCNWSLKKCCYVNSQNPCASSPCLVQHPDTKCQAGVTDRGYRCVCVKEGFTGERCQKGMACTLNPRISAFE